MSGLLSSRRRMLVLKIILRSWYVFTWILISTGVLNRLYIMPNFDALVQARMGFIRYSIGLISGLNSRLATTTAGPSVIPEREEDNTTDSVLVNAQTQTEDDLTSLSPKADAPLSSSGDDKVHGDDEALSKSYRLVRDLSSTLIMLPGLLATPGFSGTNYIANDLALQIDSLSFSGATGSTGSGGGAATMAQAKHVATLVKEEIRGLKSLSLTL